MDFKVKQVSSLEKVFYQDIDQLKEFNHKTVMRGETFSYQIAMQAPINTAATVEIDSPLKDYIKVYAVRNIPMDFPNYYDANPEDDYITLKQGVMPDMLQPIHTKRSVVRMQGEPTAAWITVKIPEDLEPGSYTINTIVKKGTIPQRFATEDFEFTLTMNIDVTNETLPKEQIYFTQWFHSDCIATAHNVEIFSDEHWDLIDKYMALAGELGINMILTPVITPPLDTDEGLRRPCVQLVKIEKNGDKYSFDYTLLKKWIDMAHKNGIEYFEVSHLFSQWGLLYTPNIKVTENGVEDYKFGWHVEAKSPEYKKFLEQFIPALIEFFKSEGIKEKCWFHISDEPSIKHIENYEYAYNIIKPLIDGCETMDALSNYEFYRKGLVLHPVTAINHIGPFLEAKNKNQWAYYCCSQYHKVSNRFLSMPSYRNRIIGLQLYKFAIQGFLQWGYNFYFSQRSYYELNPYVSTSGDMAFPSGDPFSVYPVKDGVVPSLRAVVFKEAIDDIKICKKLESLIGREAVIKMIDDEAGMDVRFDAYPKNPDYIINLIEKMELKIKELS